MLITSHLAATLVGVVGVRAHGWEVILALMGGVLVDMDHLFVNQKWRADIKDFVYSRTITRGVNQHSWLQEFLFGGIIGILGGVAVHIFSPAIRWWILPMFLLLHIAMDAVMQCEHWPFIPFSRWSYKGWLKSGTLTEFLLSVVVLGVWSLW